MRKFDSTASNEKYLLLLFLLGLGGALITSKYLGDWVFEVWQDLSHFSVHQEPRSHQGPSSTERIEDFEAATREVVVAVIDTGVDLNQSEIHNHLWRNPGESGLDPQGRSQSTNGIDDDGNGRIDDVFGWNFAAQNGDIQDFHGHGTHIAGIIIHQALSMNAHRVLIMPLKYYDPRTPGLDNLRNSLRALRFAIEMNVDIINYSGGGATSYPEEEALMREAERRGILVVAAAGNEGSHTAIKPFYPASYGLSNIISVAAIDQQMDLVSSSNFGEVDIAAPGLRIESFSLNGRREKMTGTSQATAFVTGVAAGLLMKSRMPILDLRRRILLAAPESRKLNDKVLGAKVLNPERSQSLQDRNSNFAGFHVANSQDIDPSLFFKEIDVEESMISH